MPPPNTNKMTNFNKERFWWVSFAAVVSALWVWGKASQSDANAFKDKIIAQQSATLNFKDSACAADKKSMTVHYEEELKRLNAENLALKDDKYRSVLDALNVRKINGKIKIEQ